MLGRESMTCASRAANSATDAAGPTAAPVSMRLSELAARLRSPAVAEELSPLAGVSCVLAEVDVPLDANADVPPPPCPVVAVAADPAPGAGGRGRPEPRGRGAAKEGLSEPGVDGAPGSGTP